MTNTQKRFLLFAVALPLIILMILVSWGHHLLVNIAVLAITLLGTNELARMRRHAGFRVPVKIITAASGLMPVMTYLIVLGIIPETVILMYILAAVLLVLTIPIFAMADVSFKGLLEGAAGRLLCLLYPGFFLSYIVRLTGFEYATHILAIFVLTVYLNDSNAWFVGVFFGKNSRRNIFTVSPNKSLVGFCGGIFASLVVTIGSRFLFPHIIQGPLWSVIILGLLAGITTILGDLGVSGFKRASGVKDSGTIVMGRGGLLDSIDSLLLTAPVFFYFLHYMTV
jgi:phosphatidate cytidylyltransferase